jgi:hypothetical protein
VIIIIIEDLIKELQKYNLKKEINISLSYNNNYTLDDEIYESNFYIANVGNHLEIRNNDYYFKK